MKLIHEATGAKVEVFNEERANELLNCGFIADVEEAPEKKPTRRTTKKKEDSEK